MSQENVEIARRIYEALNKGDYAAFIDGFDPEVELVFPAGGLNEGTHRGRGAVGQFIESYVESFEDFRVEPEEFFEAGDQVVAFVRTSGRGRASGVEIETRPAHLITMRGGKVRRLVAFPDREKQAALEAAGLQGQAMSDENLDTLRRNYERWAEGDWTDTSLYDPHVVYASQSTELDPGPHYGLEATGDYMRQMLASWDDMRIEAKSFRKCGDSFVVHVRRTAKGKESGAPIDDEAFHVWSFRGDKVIRFEVFAEEAEALEAVGLDKVTSDENREVVRRVYDAVAKGGTEAILSLYDRDLELDTTGLRGEDIVGVAGVYRGHEGLRRFFAEWNDAWEEYEFALEELLDAGDRVVSVVTRRGRGRASGIEVEAPGAVVWTINDGKVVRMVLFSTRTEALEAAGLAE